MGVNFSKSSHLFLFGIIIPLVSLSVSSALFNFFTKWPNWLEGPSPLLIYSIIFYLFDSYLWKIDIFRQLGIVWYPDLNGRWKGRQRSSHQENGQNVSGEGRLEIKQTFSKINISAYYGRSNSESVIADFSDLNGEVYLFYTYDNDPSSLKTGTMAKHRGTSKIKKLPKENKLSGCYWNSLSNFGEMEYEFEQKDLLGRF